jgi:hypothetical protein
MGMGMDMGGAITAVAATTMVGIAVTIAAGGIIIGIGGDFHLGPNQKPTYRGFNTAKPKSGDCCVFCSYATVPCPPGARTRSAVVLQAEQREGHHKR